MASTDQATENATPMTAEEQKFAWHVTAATKLAMEHFDQIIQTHIKEKTPQAAGIRKYLRNEFDWKREDFSVKETISGLEIDKNIYLDAAAQVRNADMLYELLEVIADDQIDDLFFQDNDYPRASIRRDQLAHFVESITHTLREEHLLAPDDTRFSDLVNGYNCALSGYLEMREIINDHTDKKFSSLLEWSAITAIDENLADHDATDKRTEELAVQRYNEIFEAFDLGTGNDTILPPAYLHLAVLAKKIATREALNASPYETDSETINQLQEPYYDKLMRSIAGLGLQLHRVADASKAEHVLMDRYAEVFQQPRDFHRLVEEASKQAAAYTMQSMPRLYKEADRDLKSIETKGRTYMEEQGVVPYTSNTVARLLKAWSRAMEEKLQAGMNYQEIGEIFEQDADAVLQETTCGLEHPAMILLRRNYAEAFGKALVQAVKAEDSAMPTMRANDVFAAVCEKYDYAYEAHWETANWCLSDTNGAYGDYGQYALMMALTSQGQNYGEMTREEALEVPDDARKYIASAAEHRGIEAAWAHHPFTPLLYRKALDYAIEGQHRGVTRRPPEVMSDRAPGQDHTPLEISEIRNAMAQGQDSIEQAWVKVLHRTMGMFPAAPDNDFGVPAPRMDRPEEQAPYVDAKSLREAMQFFETSHKRSRVS